MNNFIYRLLFLLFLSSTLFANTFYVGQSGSPGGNYFTDIQSAVYAAGDGDSVIVSNGTYVLSSEINVTNGLTIQSVNGSDHTIVDGNNSNRCFNLREKNIVLSGFTITNGNSGISYGGGINCYEKTAEINNCTIIGNSSVNSGGGVCYGILNNCKLINNIASYGGGAYKSIVSNSLFAFNVARSSGGGTYKTSNNNCTIVGNSSLSQGGGTTDGTNKNTIVYYNYAPDGINRKNGVYDYCCTTPDGTNGTGNISEEPILVSSTYITTNSPCVGAGLFAYAGGVDIDGELWKNPPAIGCDEPYASAILGSLSVSIKANRIFTYVNIPLTFSADISGKLYQNSWDLDDGTTETNKFQVTHSWSETGKYNVGLTAYNNTHPAGVSGFVEVNIITNIHYVNINNPSPVPPYSTWATAATNIQAAVDVADIGGKILVTNGMYVIYPWIYVDKSVIIETINGPENTLVVATNRGRCFYMDASNIVVSGFTITNGNSYSGAGVYSYYQTTIITNCIIVGNLANTGGGVDKCIVNNSIISGNTATRYGGGAHSSIINNSTITGNSAGYGGGTHSSIINNSIINGNSAGSAGGTYKGSAYNCEINGNSASYAGGGVYYGIISNCTINGNSATNSGGGAYKTIVRNCIISGNVANVYGGGAFDSVINNCTIIGNSAVDGGGTYDGTVINCEISGNNADSFGGGAYFKNGSEIYNCTIAGNNASGSGGGICTSNGGTVGNCIIYNNLAFLGDNNWINDSSGAVFSYCLTTPTNGLPGGNGCIDDTPLFVKDTFPDLNYRLLEGSPCINAGFNMPWMSGTTDLDGNPRIIDGIVDMGAYEFIPEPFLFIIYYLSFLICWRKFISCS